MAQLNIAIDDQTLKDLMLGDRDKAVLKLLESVFNTVLCAEAADQLGAEPRERTGSGITDHNGHRTDNLRHMLAA